MGISHLVIGETFHPQSPIERDFAEALGHFSLWMQDHGVSVSLQEPIGPFRADFVLRMRGQSPLVVECDGKRFHSSKEQRERDAARDAYMGRITLRVHRIAGHALYAHPTLCARVALMELSGHGSSVVENCGGHSQERQDALAAWARRGTDGWDPDEHEDPEDGYDHDRSDGWEE